MRSIYLARKVADDCLVELRWLYDRGNTEGVRWLRNAEG